MISSPENVGLIVKLAYVIVFIIIILYNSIIKVKITSVMLGCTHKYKYQ